MTVNNEEKQEFAEYVYRTSDLGHTKGEVFCGDGLLPMWLPN
jgi:hypothetical protein